MDPKKLDFSLENLTKLRGLIIVFYYETFCF
jgi:hypothetical protein